MVSLAFRDLFYNIPASLKSKFMIRLIFVQKSDIRDAFCRAFSLERIETTPFFTSYQK